MTHAYYDISPWSPDGTRLVWSRRTQRPFGEIYVTDVRDGTSKRIVERSYFIFESGADPVWVSDTVVYFVGGEPGALNVHAVDVTSGEVRQVTGHSGVPWLNGIHLNADKTKMAYFYFPGRNTQVRFAVAEIEGGLLLEVQRNPDGDLGQFHPKWHPTDPNLLLYYDQPGTPKKLWSMRISDEGSVAHKFLTTFSDHAHWCPDGACIVLNDYVGHPSGRTSRVHLMDVDGSNKREVKMDREINTFHTHPTLSPDGSTIAIDPRFDRVWSGYMLLVDIETGAVRELVSNALEYGVGLAVN